MAKLHFKKKQISASDTAKAPMWNASRTSRNLRLSLVLVLTIAGGLPAVRTRAQNENPEPTATNRLHQIARLRKSEGNLELSIDWNPVQGFSCSVTEQQTGCRARLKITGQEISAEKIPPPDDEAGQANRPIPLNVHSMDGIPKNTQKTSLVIKFRETEWIVYFKNVLAGRLPAPFTPPATVHCASYFEESIEGNPRFQPVEKENFHSDFMIEEDAPNQLFPWEPRSGKWRVHTIMEDALKRPESDVDRIKKVPLTPDKSPNFYSLKGKGDDGILVTGHDFFDDYSYSAAVQVNDGEAGLVFYFADRKNYYAFTVTIRPPPYEGGELALWRVQNGVKTFLGRAKTDLFINQWYVPRIETDVDRIRCFLDNRELFSVSEPLPPGGKIGLFVNAQEEITFDDVDLAGVQGIDLRGIDRIKYWTLEEAGEFTGEDPLISEETQEEPGCVRVSVSDEPRSLLLGKPHHSETIFSARFHPRSRIFEAGIIAGYKSPEKPFYRFTVRRLLGNEIYRLTRVTGETKETLQSWQRGISNSNAAKGIRLSADASEPSLFRLLVDDKLVLLHELDGPLSGASGLYAGPSAALTVSELDYRFEKKDLYKEKEQKNPVFEDDSFMRHWASPEGQWVADKNGHLWHKGDFYGDFEIALPCVKGGELHAGVPDEGSRGTIMVTVSDNLITMRLGPGNEDFTTSTEAELDAYPDEEGKKPESFVLSREGHWVWISLNQHVALKRRLPSDLHDTRVMAKGYTLKHMASSRVHRNNVIDDFFTETPHNWIINGGDWQIINRFQCTPSWSHMIGESHEGMAALWHKFVYTGDMTVEFYAGTRHGWYDRTGDLNCTVMASTTAPDTGYTVTCTEWDQNLSQNWSTLFRRGKVIDRSEKYLVPRYRAEGVRKFLNPLLSTGRPVHGAWYYIKLRRKGNALEYYFDNELVFSYEDPKVIREGLLGIWTFIHSMTLAQIKVTFTEIKPRPFPVRILPAQPDKELDKRQEAESATEKQSATGEPILTANGFPLNPITEQYWSIEDNVGHAKLKFFDMETGCARVTNQMGSGNMFAASQLPALPAELVAGWKLMIKRTENAALNFHYSAGKNGTKSDSRKNFFHHISGTDFSKGEFVLTGKTHVPPCDSIQENFGDWHKVTVWIPSSCRPRAGSRTRKEASYDIRLEGIGCRQPSRVMCGIGGARPGDAYAVRGLSPIFYGTPELALQKDSVAPGGMILTQKTVTEPIIETDNIEELNAALREISMTGMNIASIQIEKGDGTQDRHTLTWIELPDDPGIEVDWHTNLPDVIQVRTPADYVDPRLRNVIFGVSKEKLELNRSMNEIITASLPRSKEFLRNTNRPVEVMLYTYGKNGRETESVTLPWGKANALKNARYDTQTGKLTTEWSHNTTNDTPVLLEIPGLTPFCETFESDAKGEHLKFENDGRMKILQDEDALNRCLEVRNLRLKQRLKSAFITGFSMAEYPLFQLKYLASDMTNLSMVLNTSQYAYMSEEHSNAEKVRLSHQLKLDDSWHSWLGFVSDALTRDSFSTTRFSNKYFQLRSIASHDQTGRYSAWSVDDLVFGPAVAGPEQLKMNPRFFDRDGISHIEVAVSPGETCFSDLDESAEETLEWHSFDPGQEIIPPIDGLGDGVHHILIRACDPLGKQSTITDVPFLLDTQPLKLSSYFKKSSVPASNGVMLRIRVPNGGGAPWAISKAQFEIAGEKQEIPAWLSEFTHSAKSDLINLNYPFAARRELDDAKDGDIVMFSIDGIRDGAGNTSPRLDVPIKVNHAEDKTGPSWYVFRFHDTVNWFWNWDGCRNTSAAFSPDSNNTTEPVHKAGDSPYLMTKAYKTRGSIARNVDWKPVEHPWLSCRICLPVYNSKTQTRIMFILETKRHSKFILSLMKPSKSSRELADSDSAVQWKAKEWKRLSFNIRDLLRKNKKINSRELKDLTIKKVTIYRSGTEHREVLMLDDFFIHSAGSDKEANDILSWVAYDVSGVASLEIACIDEADKTLWQKNVPSRDIRLDQLRKKAKGKSWLRCRAKDNAGNLSVPFWFPFPEP